MKKMTRGETEKFQNGETCLMSEYSLGDETVDAAIAQIKGRYPDEGWVMNRISKEIAFVINGQGRLIHASGEEKVEVGDVVLLEPGEKFYWEGNMDIFISCTPAWKYSQYEHIVD
jgi:mannose-6-phosphate isomerase-like protein (cupin superfamily)